MQILDIKDIRNNKNKLQVILDNGTSFILYKKEIYRLSLKKGLYINKELYNTLLNEIFIKRARKRAMNLLLKKDRSESELRNKLISSGYLIEAVEDAIRYMYKYHYLDDLRLARNYIRYYGDIKSKLSIKINLQKKGIDKDIIYSALTEELNVSDSDKIINILNKRNYNRDKSTEKDKAKEYRYLLSKGFNQVDILRYL